MHKIRQPHSINEKKSDHDWYQIRARKCHRPCTTRILGLHKHVILVIDPTVNSILLPNHRAIPELYLKEYCQEEDLAKSSINSYSYVKIL